VGRLYALKLVNLKFESEIGRVDQFPSRFVPLYVSLSWFSIEALQQLFELLGLMNDIAVPIAFETCDLIIDVSYYEGLEDLDFGAFQANLCEFDWRGNRIPAISLRWLFAFLATQTMNWCTLFCLRSLVDSLIRYFVR
jgi:hypothetical protein